MANIRKRETGYQAQVRVRGYPPLTKSFKTKADAVQWASEREAELRRGTYVDTRSLRAETLRELLERYLREVTPTHKGAEVEAIRLKALMRLPMAALTLDRVDSTVIQAWREERQGKVKGETVRREMNLLSAVFRRAQGEWHYPLSNPLTNLIRPSKSDGRQRRPTWSELKALLRRLSPRTRKDGLPSENRNPWIRPAAVLALRTAMRQGEILATRWEWVDFDNRRIRLPDTKNGTARDVPLSRKAELVLRRLDDGRRTGPVFPTTRSAFRQAFGDARDKAGITDLRFHDFRHDATTRIAKRVRNVLELSAITGHKDPRMLKRYYNPEAKDLAAMLD